MCGVCVFSPFVKPLPPGQASQRGRGLGGSQGSGVWKMWGGVAQVVVAEVVGDDVQDLRQAPLAQPSPPRPLSNHAAALERQQPPPPARAEDAGGGCGRAGREGGPSAVWRRRRCPLAAQRRARPPSGLTAALRGSDAGSEVPPPCLSSRHTRLSGLRTFVHRGHALCPDVIEVSVNPAEPSLQTSGAGGSAGCAL